MNLKKINAENTASSCTIFEVTPEQLRLIADRLDQQRRDCVQAGESVVYMPDPSTVWIYRPERVALIQNGQGDDYPELHHDKQPL